jgi:hypothetical protein
MIRDPRHKPQQQPPSTYEYRGKLLRRVPNYRDSEGEMCTCNACPFGEGMHCNRDRHKQNKVNCVGPYHYEEGL